MGRIILPVSTAEEAKFSKDSQYRQYKPRTSRVEHVVPAIRLCGLEMTYKV